MAKLKIFKRKANGVLKEKMPKRSIYDLLLENPEISAKKPIKEQSLVFLEKLKKANAENISLEILDYAISSSENGVLSSKNFINYFQKRESRVLKKTANYILQYQRSSTSRKIDLGLTINVNNKITRYLVRIVNFKYAGDQSIVLCSNTKNKLATIFENLGFNTIKAELSIYDPVHKINIAIYPEFTSDEISLVDSKELKTVLSDLEKKYNKKTHHFSELQEATLNEIMGIHVGGSLPIYKFVKDVGNYKIGDLIIDTRIN